MTRTYLDAGVLVTAARGDAALSGAAIEILCDPAREFVSSVLVRLEVLPRAQTPGEIEFYETYFKEVANWMPVDSHLLSVAIEEARSSGVSPSEAIHLVLAAAAGCHEFVTAEKPGSPIFGTKRITVKPLN